MPHQSTHLTHLNSNNNNKNNANDSLNNSPNISANNNSTMSDQQVSANLSSTSPNAPKDSHSHNPTVVLTYGTFDLFHIGHLKMLERLRAMGDKLIVAVSTDEFNRLKGKTSVYSFEERSQIVAALACVDEVIPEHNWEQKQQDIQTHQVDIFGIGEDWRGKFDHLMPHCQVVYLERTPSISTTEVKRALSNLDSDKIKQIKDGLDSVLSIVKAIE